MELKNVMLKACCNNCRHTNRDENAAYNKMRRKDPTPLKPFCPRKGLDEGVCVKFVPRKTDVAHAIWLARTASADGVRTSDWKPIETAPVCTAGCHWIRALSAHRCGPPEYIVCFAKQEDLDAAIADKLYMGWMPCDYRLHNDLSEGSNDGN